MTHINTSFSRRGSRAFRVALIIVVLVISGMVLGVGNPAQPVARAQAAPTAAQNQDLFGVVGRDPFYEWNTDHAKFPNATNKTALEQEAKELRNVGAKWVRMEFFADYDGSVAPGDINWNKYDYFINDLAPK